MPIGSVTGRQLSADPMPAKFIVGGGAAYLSSIGVRASTRFRVRLIGPGQADGNLAGPFLTDRARRNCGFVIAFGGEALNITISDSDLTEPYTVDGNQAVRNFMLKMLETRRAGPMDVAFVWNLPGAGETGYRLASFTTRGGAAAP